MSLMALPLTALVREPLTPIERFRARDQLQDLWRVHVTELTELAVQFHGYDAESDDASAADAVARELTVVRARLVEIEHAMRRLDAGKYGVCEGCGIGIEAAELVAWPDRRYCAACHVPADDAGR